MKYVIVLLHDLLISNHKSFLFHSKELEMCQDYATISWRIPSQ